MSEPRAARLLWVSRHRITPASASGTPYRMISALRELYPELIILDGLSPQAVWQARARPTLRLLTACSRLAPSLLTDRIRGTRYDWDRSPSLSRYYAYRIQKAIRQHRPDILIGDKAYVEWAHLETRIPIIYLHDALAEDLLEYDAHFRSFSPRSRRNALGLQRMALERATLRVFSSEWARASCLQHYPHLSNHTFTAYSGPNFPASHLPDALPIRRLVPPIRFLLVGLDWERKGCDEAIAIVDRIRMTTALDIRLDICGAVPPSGNSSLPSFVTLHRRLGKAIQSDLDVLQKLYLNAHFFILPSIAECLSVACIEAMAFGLPCIVRDCGGQRELMNSPHAGFLIQGDATASEFIDRITRALTDETRYHTCAQAAYYSRRQHFDWDAWADRISAGIERAHVALIGKATADTTLQTTQ